MSPDARTRALARSLRSPSSLLSWIICCSVLIAYGVTTFVPYVLSSLLIVTSYGFVTIYNDLNDYEIDISNNRKDIPLANNEISREDLLRLLSGLLIVACIVAILLNLAVLLWLSVYFFLGWLYSGPARLKSRGIFAAVILGICYGVMPLLLGYIIARQPLIVWSYFSLMAALFFTTGIVLLKDFKDVKGDQLYNKNTFLVLHGADATYRLIASLTSIGYLTIIISMYAANRTDAFIYVSIGVLISNLYLLLPKKMRFLRELRRRNGNLARLIFFLYIGILNILIL